MTRNLIACMFCLTAISASSAVLHGRVVAVSDGDTINVLDADLHVHKIRLAGIDAPEKAQPFGQRSKEHMAGLVHGHTVKVEWTKKDRYDRIVGQVWVQPPDCKSCGLTLDASRSQLEAGLAWWYRKYAHEQAPKDRTDYEAEESRARERKLGLWSDPNPLPPWDWRKGVGR